MLSELTLRRNRHVASIMTFAGFLGLGFVLPLLPIFVRELGVQSEQAAIEWAGVLVGIGPLLAGALAPFWGRVADRRGFRLLATVGLSLLGLSQLIASFATSPFHVLISRVLSGVFGGIGPLGVAMAARNSVTKASGAIGAVQAAQILAAGFGPWLGGVVASTWGPRWAFGIAAFICLVAALVVAALYVDQENATQDTIASSTPRESARSLVLAGVPAMAAILFFANFASRSFTPILPTQLHAVGVSADVLAARTGLLISVYSICAAASALILGSLASRVGASILLVTSLVLSACANAPMAFAASFPSFLASGAFFGLVSGGALTLGYSLAHSRIPESARSTALGWLSGAALFGGAVAPVVASQVARFGLPAVYAMNAFALIAVIPLALVARPRA